MVSANISHGYIVPQHTKSRLVDIIQTPQAIYKLRFTLHTGYSHGILLELVNSPGVRFRDDAIRQEFLRCPGEFVLASITKSIVIPYAFTVHPPERFVKRVK